MKITQRDVYGNPSSIHTQGRKSKSIIEKARTQLADAIGAKPDQIIFTSGGSESNNQVLWSMIYSNKKLAHFMTFPATLSQMRHWLFLKTQIYLLLLPLF